MNTPVNLAGVTEGDILAGKYRVDRVLGVGGMGVVVAAHHIQLDDPVAIKFLLGGSLANREAVARFAREARAAVKIKSEHVARVTDVGTLENGAPYMVMEYLEGSDLSQWLESRGALPTEQAVDFLLHACEAIAEAHTLGIVHRDLKPANLFVARRPGGVQSVKVLDFGISKLTGLSGSGSESLGTKASALMGSPLYMSPEQMRSSKDVDTRGDIWALGVILYELVTGKSPFTADTMPELILKIMSSPPPPLRDLLPDAPDGLEGVLLRCLEKDRGRRYQSVGELAVALLPYGSKRARASADRISAVMQAAGMSASALALPPSSGDAVPAKEATTAAAFGGTASGGRKTRPALLAAGVLLLLVGAGAAVLRVGRSPNTETVTENSAVASPPAAPTVPVAVPPAPAPAASVPATAAPVVAAVVAAADSTPKPRTAAPRSSQPAGGSPRTQAPAASAPLPPAPATAAPAAAPATAARPAQAPAAQPPARPAVSPAVKKSTGSLIDDRL